MVKNAKSSDLFEFLNDIMCSLISNKYRKTLMKQTRRLLRFESPSSFASRIYSSRSLSFSFFSPWKNSSDLSAPTRSFLNEFVKLIKLKILSAKFATQKKKKKKIRSAMIS